MIQLTCTYFAKVSDLWWPGSRASGLQLASVCGSSLPQGHYGPLGGQGGHGPNLLCASGSDLLLRGPLGAGGQGPGRCLQGMAGKVPQHLGGKLRLKKESSIFCHGGVGAGVDMC